MKFLAYKSTPTNTAAIESYLVDIFNQSQKFNTANNIHGTLFYTGDFFIQALEGPTAAIEMLMQNIMDDKRHKKIQILFDTEVKHHSLRDWNMEPLDLTRKQDFSSKTLMKAIDIVSNTMKLDAEGFVFLLTELLAEPEFQSTLKNWHKKAR